MGLISRKLFLWAASGSRRSGPVQGRPLLSEEGTTHKAVKTFLLKMAQAKARTQP